MRAAPSSRDVPYLWFGPEGDVKGALVFAHGFSCAPWRYAATMTALAAAGYAVAAPTTRTGPLPSHAGFAADIRHVLREAHARVLADTGRSVPLAVAGHSMGGGCAVLAAAGWPSVRATAHGLPPLRALVLLAPMRTIPSTYRAARFVRAPALVVVGTADRIVSPDLSRGIARALGASVTELEGGSHCGFLDRPVRVGCDRGPMPPEEQRAHVAAAAVSWLDRQLSPAGS